MKYAAFIRICRLAMLLSVLTVASAIANAATTTFAYAPRDAAPDPSGTGKKETYDIAIALTNPALTGKSITQIDIPVIGSAKVSDLSIWLTHALRLELVNGKNTNIVDQSWNVDMPQSGYIQWVSLTLDEPYIIPEGGVYVGYSLTVNDVDRTEGTQVPIVTADGVKEGGFFMHTSRSFINWADRSEELNVTALTQVMLDGEFSVNAATLGTLPNDYIALGDNQIVKVPVYNTGLIPIESINYTATLGDAAISSTINLDTPIPAVFAYYEIVSFSLPEVTTTGDLQCTLSITGVNNQPNDDGDITISGMLTALAKLPKHLALVEEFTGTWCGWCPYGYVAMEKMNELYPDDFIGVAYHDRDPMSMLGGYPLLHSGYPEVAINRQVVTHPYEATGQKGVFSLPQLWQQYCADFVPVDIVVNASVNADSIVTATTNVEWVLPVDDQASDYRIEYILVADSLHGSEFGWWQHNYFATEPMTPGMEFFCNQATYVPNLEFNDVAILTSGLEGVPSSISTVEPEVVNTHTYTFDLREAVNIYNSVIPFDINKLRVVAFLIKGDGYGTVINATKCKVDASEAGIGSIDADNQIIATEYYDLQGRQLSTPAKGLSLRTVRYANGQSVTTKVIN